jgi:hypothetical protein
MPGHTNGGLFYSHLQNSTTAGDILAKLGMVVRNKMLASYQGVSINYKLSTGGSLGPNRPFYDEKFEFENGLFSDEKPPLLVSNCSAETASPKNSNIPDLFYLRMDLSIAIIKLGSNFFTFSTIVRFL